MSDCIGTNFKREGLMQLQLEANAEIARLRASLESIVRAWESLPEGRHSPMDIEEWLRKPMKRAIDKARKTLAPSNAQHDWLSRYLAQPNYVSADPWASSVTLGTLSAGQKFRYAVADEVVAAAVHEVAIAATAYDNLVQVFSFCNHVISASRNADTRVFVIEQPAPPTEST